MQVLSLSLICIACQTLTLSTKVISPHIDSISLIDHIPHRRSWYSRDPTRNFSYHLSKSLVKIWNSVDLRSFTSSFGTISPHLEFTSKDFRDFAIPWFDAQGLARFYSDGN